MARHKVMISSLVPIRIYCRKEIFPFGRISIQLGLTYVISRSCVRLPNVRRGRINADLPCRLKSVSVLSRICNLYKRANSTPRTNKRRWTRRDVSGCPIYHTSTRESRNSRIYILVRVWPLSLARRDIRSGLAWIISVRHAHRSISRSLSRRRKVYLHSEVRHFHPTAVDIPRNERARRELQLTRLPRRRRNIDDMPKDR